MDLISVRELFKNTSAYAGKEVTVGGWVRSVRASKQFGFIVLNDGTFFTPVQVVYHDTMDNFNEISKVNVGAALIVKGDAAADPRCQAALRNPGRRPSPWRVPPPRDYPLQKKRHTVEFLRTMPHLRPRTNIFQAVFRVRSLAAYAIHQFFQERDFVYVHTPADHRLRLRGRRRDVPGDHPGPEQRAARPKTARWITARISSASRPT